jgi:hypothetical protein
LAKIRPMQPAAPVHGHDAFVKRDGEWRISRIRG